MASHLRPTVHVEEIPHANQPVADAPTSVAAIAGPGGAATVIGPVRVRSWADYEMALGGIRSETDALGLAAYNFFRNGGEDAWIIPVAGGCRGAIVDMHAYRELFTRLEGLPDVRILLLPGQHARTGGNPVLDAAVTHCEAMGDRMVVIDAPPDVALANADTVAGLGLPASAHAALYYPWVDMAHPLRNGGADTPGTLTVAPAPFAAGVWARTDRSRGVWKAPAGVQARLHGASGLQHAVTDAAQGWLNPAGVNCLRTFPERGMVIWGARTLAPATHAERRYIPVQRTLAHVDRSLREGTQWVAFEPNDQPLWTTLRSSITTYLHGLFRAGALQGQKASDAYFVRCGLGDTMTSEDVARGEVVAMVGLALLKPAEFLIIRMRQRTGGAA